VSDDDDEISDDEIRDALRAIHAGDARLKHVLCLGAASHDFETPLMLAEVIEAIAVKYEIDGDVANGGLDQVAWNHGVEATRAYATAFRAVGAIENADVLDRLATTLVEYQDKHGDQIAKDPVKHFLAYRRAVGGPEFGIPEHGDELAEVVLEYVIARAATLPAADAPLVRKPQ
jgi:hypothetical protein